MDIICKTGMAADRKDFRIVQTVSGGTGIVCQGIRRMGIE